MADVKKLRESITKVLSYDKSRLVSRSDWGAINFATAAQDIDAIFEIASLLNDLPIERLPSSAADRVADALNSANGWLEQNDKFDLTNGGTPSKRDEIVQNLRAQHENLYTQAHNWIPFLAYLKGDIPEQLATITGSVTLAQQTMQDFDKYAQGQKDEIAAIVKATREAAAEAGVASFTEDFLRDADARETDAKTWLTRSMISAAVTLVVATIFLFFRPDLNEIGLLQFAISKMVILGLLIGVTAWCAGNFKANKHQEAVSRFKAHALKTFQAFTAATDNKAIRDAVLLETTRSIFSQPQSGYLRSESGGDANSTVVELIKNSTKGD
ncbi:hypothetical protein [Pseudoxanthomonas suwonensis]|jgi:hypothetical protein|uniref:hypothetical protein n=1 Tax=Pseudoxanthomonas suwonensis TaxID=314722 RepID=UPI00046545E2|nr:hypothetical protein [Pseudoxanthomonas suwonensis]